MELVELIEKLLEKKEEWDQSTGEGRSLRLEETCSFTAARRGAAGDGEEGGRSLWVEVEVKGSGC